MYEYFTRHLKEDAFMTTIKKNAEGTIMTTDTNDQIPTSVVVVAGVPTEAPIEFRQDKFAKRVDPDFAEKLIPIVEEFIQKPRRNALGLLWQLLYNPQRYLHRIGLTLVNVDDPEISDEDREHSKDLLYIPQDIWTHFWNELRFQYAKYNIGFPDIEVPAGCEDAYKALNDSTVKNHVLCAVVLDHCMSMVSTHVDQKLSCEDKKAAERAIYLMNSTRDNNVFGGVSSLSFNKAEAEFLKRYATKISALLQAILNEKVARCGIEEAAPDQENTSAPNTAEKHVTDAQDEGFNRPFADLEKKAIEAWGKLPSGTSDEPVETGKTISADEDIDLPDDHKSLISDDLTIDVLRQNQEAISNFLAAYKQLEELGIDPAEVICKSESIAKAFEVFKAFG